MMSGRAGHGSRRRPSRFTVVGSTIAALIAGAVFVLLPSGVPEGLPPLADSDEEGYVLPRSRADVPGQDPDRLPAGDGTFFDVSSFRLDRARLHFGLGREHFPALIDPDLVDAAQVDWIEGEDRVLAVRVGDELHVYPLELMERFEVVNDVVGGRPVLVAYCVLADLGAVYRRRFDGHTFTFAVSGYTYADPDVWGGRDAFVLWDRDTESLWWPPIGRAVSGPMVDRPLPLLDEELWAQTSWAAVRDADESIRVLARDQDFRPPGSWPRYRPQAEGDDGDVELPPRWGAKRRFDDAAGQ